MFYNVENLFDTFDDPAKNDDEFTSDGEKGWNYFRYKEKLNNIAKVIIAVGGWQPPDIIGLCEVENFQVLFDLTTETPLKNYGYQIIHEDSKDSRGIDNALLFIPKRLKKVVQKSISLPQNAPIVTRDILFTSFAFDGKDTVSIYVNHWPSRYGGKEFSESRRIHVAHALRMHVDSLRNVDVASKILIMGDFNDEPSDRSLYEILKAREFGKDNESDHLLNLSFPDFRKGAGTIVYKEIDYTWYMFDQIIVTPSLIDGNGLVAKDKKSTVFQPSWLLENQRPKRTYQGPIYLGGFSDHLPIFIDLIFKE